MSSKSLFFLISFLFSKWVIGQNYPITVVSEQPFKVQSGQISSVIVKVRNDDSSKVTLTSGFIKQTIISCISCNQTIVLEPKTEKSIILPLLVSKNSIPCDIKFMYTLSIGDSTVSEKEIVVSVQRKTSFSISMINAPEYVRAGEALTARVIIQNNGNTVQKFNLIKYGFYDKGPRELMLGSGEIYNYDIIIKTSALQPKADFLTYGIKIHPFEDSSMTKDMFHSSYVFPVVEPKKSQYFYLPGYIRLNYLASNRDNASASGYQIEAQFRGTLDQAKKHQVELAIRGPNRFSSSVLGNYDEYFARYSTKNYKVHAGDKVFYLTPLSEISRFGRGVEISKIEEKYAFGAFYAKPRFNTSITSEYAAYGSFVLENSLKLSLNHLGKKDETTNALATVNSLLANYTLEEKISVEAELSQSHFLQKNDFGFRSVVFIKRKKFNLNFSNIVAGKNYAGYYSNTSYYIFNSSYQLNKKTDININYNKNFQNPVLDSIITNAPNNTSYFLGASHRLTKDLNARLLYRVTEVEDRSELKSFNYKSNQIQVNLNQKLHNFAYTLMVDYGINNNLLLGEDSSRSRIWSVYSEVQFFRATKFNFNVFQNFLNSNRYSFKNENSVFYGANLSWNINKFLVTSFRYQSNYFPEDYYRNRDAIDLRINYKAESRLDFSMATRYVFLARQSTAKELYLMASCNYKIHVPLKKIASYGKISGNISSNTGKSVQNILVQLNGRTAITKKDGSFTFGNVPAGNYFLFVDQKSLFLNEIIEQPTPYNVVVEEGKTVTVSLNIINAAKVSGTVKVVFKKNAYYDDTTVTTIPSVVLIIKNENESQTIVSGVDGSFVFHNLKPGHWQLNVYDNLLDNKYIVEKELFNFDLKSNDHSEIIINIRKKDKKIRFMQAPGALKK